jgi:hypothetical protein
MSWSQDRHRDFLEIVIPYGVRHEQESANLVLFGQPPLDALRRTGHRELACRLPHRLRVRPFLIMSHTFYIDRSRIKTDPIQ